MACRQVPPPSHLVRAAYVRRTVFRVDPPVWPAGRAAAVDADRSRPGACWSGRCPHDELLRRVHEPQHGAAARRSVARPRGSGPADGRRRRVRDRQRASLRDCPSLPRNPRWITGLRPRPRSRRGTETRPRASGRTPSWSRQQIPAIPPHTAGITLGESSRRWGDHSVVHRLDEAETAAGRRVPRITRSPGREA